MRPRPAFIRDYGAPAANLLSIQSFQRIAGCAKEAGVQVWTVATKFACVLSLLVYEFLAPRWAVELVGADCPVQVQYLRNLRTP
jgi:hypothetical protein